MLFDCPVNFWQKILMGSQTMARSEESRLRIPPKAGEGGDMIVKIQLGIGAPGKLWTGSLQFFPCHEYTAEGNADRPSLSGQLCEVELAEHWSESGASTRRLYHRNTFAANEAEKLETALEIPMLHVATGGVGSLPIFQIGSGDIREDVAVWNWSGRVGGFAILDPIKVFSGYYDPEDLPMAKPGFAWIDLYRGSTLSEFVLVQLDENGWVHPRHRLAVHRRPRPVLSPPEKREQERRDEEATAEFMAEGLPAPVKE